MKFKVCGMRDPGNIHELSAINPDFIGFIFYPYSKRYVGREPSPEIFTSIPESIKKTGIFVDEPAEVVSELYRRYRLDFIQLHGNELPDYCHRLTKENVRIIKAFKIDDQFEFSSTLEFETCCDYFLFDTAGVNIGGTGHKFEWNLLDQYKGEKPFFLSGGIGPADAEMIKSFRHSSLYGIDLNSGFETEPGYKDISKLRSFISEIRLKHQSK